VSAVAASIVAAAAAAPAPLLEVSGLSVSFPTRRGPFTAVRNLDLRLESGETLAIVGESGSGKSVTALAATRLIDHTGGSIDAGRILLRDRAGELIDVVRAGPAQLRQLRGPDLAMIFQEPMTSLNPVLRIGEQIGEGLTLHQGLDRRAARSEARRMLERVRIPDAATVLDRYPFQLSGGMRQRVMIAVALACRPRLLIADEPTTALDVTVQAQVLRLLRGLRQEFGMAMIFITHDMGVVAEIADRVLVMRAGEKVEEGEALSLFVHPRHPYTQALLAAVPVLGSLRGRPLPVPFPEPAVPAPIPQDTVDRAKPPVLVLDGLTTGFDVRRGALGRRAGRIHAAERVSLEIYAGETLALVGESGCGKSTTGRSIIRLHEPAAGRILLAGKDITRLDRATEPLLRRQVQYVFQDPLASLDPRLTVGFSVSEPILVHRLAAGAAVERRVRALLEQVGLSAAHLHRYPHELSGGQRQRVAIARALASEPRLIIADEAVAALDVSIRGQIVNLLMALQAQLGLAYLFISHDMAVVERIAHRIAVMYLGQIVEIGPRPAVMEAPAHAYTRRLLAAVPVPDPRLRGHDRDLDESEVPSPLRPLGAAPIVAPLLRVGPEHYVARHSVGGLY
jgi:glutathione transport system ATP-binding protein